MNSWIFTQVGDSIEWIFNCFFQAKLFYLFVLLRLHLTPTAFFRLAIWKKISTVKYIVMCRNYLTLSNIRQVVIFDKPSGRQLCNYICKELEKLTR